MAFLKVIRLFVQRFRNYDGLKFFLQKFLEFLKKEKHCNSGNIEDFRKSNGRFTVKYIKIL